MAARLILAAAALTFAAVSHAGETPKIDQASLLKRIESKDSSLVILDVRSPEEFKAGHVPGAINIPYTHLPSRISEVADAADKDIVVYCAIGVRAELGAERLRENGFTKLLHLDGDMKAWEEKKRPLVK
ncbi:rhodanese-like domain-containing protein [Steroidobacter sp.]|uniref:rhodanese-like domain-containing protein n=1 Tax=Steroidobacter sp. TaxID=1978227 RepID=UPI001A4CA773|nr:rhodanese-like domain-containing protein [Steroidobacter sp.]MBL8269541.1 rhodanese-like domain-containing protein [Steroidobacter sp.]